MRKVALIVLPFLIGIAILAVLAHVIDVRQAFRQIRIIGPIGTLLFILNVGVTFLAPAAGWYLLMRADGIPVTPRQTFVSALMGHAFNLVTPMMYVGGEPIRTFYIAGVCKVPKRQVVASIIVNKFQELSGLVLLILAGTVIMMLAGGLKGSQLVTVACAGPLLLAFLIVVLCMFLGDVKPTVKLLDLCIRLGFFADKLRRVRDLAVEMEVMVRDTFIKRWRVFLVSFLLTVLSPLAQFVRPILFYGLLHWPRLNHWPSVSELLAVTDFIPTLAQLSLIFVLSQVVFMMPSTPAGLGVYEGVLVLAFTLVGRPEADGAAFGLMIRLADILFIAGGSWLTIHYGMTSLLKKAVADEEPPVTNLANTNSTGDVRDGPRPGA